MKKWYKLSLGSLLIPTIGVIGLTVVGCGHQSTSSSEVTSQNFIKPPILKATNALNAYGTDLKVSDWWSNNFKDLEAKLKQINQWINEPLNIDAINAINVNPASTLGKFTFTINLNTNYSFDQTSSVLSWTSPETSLLSYFITLPLPSLINNHEIKHLPKDANAWWGEKTDTDKIDALNQLLTDPKELNSSNVSKVEINPVGSDINQFTFKVTLQGGYVFSDDLHSPIWESPKDSPITYIHSTEGVTFLEMPMAKEGEASLVIKSTGAEKTAKEWWDNVFIKQTKVDQLTWVKNRMATSLGNITENNISFDFLPIEGSPTLFNIKLSLSGDYAFGTAEQSSNWGQIGQFVFQPKQ